MKPFRLAFVATLAALPSAALACACGVCALNSDWETQGLASGAGLRLDLRYDYMNQTEIRHGTSKLAAWPAGHEAEQFTQNRYTTAALDYSTGSWGVNVQLPWIDRKHGTLDGLDDGLSHSKSVGDMRVLGRYQGLAGLPNLGVQFGLKLPTGSHTETFSAGALAGEPLDRGLQPGSGTTDLLLGAYTFAMLTPDWDYYAQALVQLPLDSRAGYQPGNAFALNLGLRYEGFEAFVPELQFNARASGKDSGVNAAPEDSGGESLYISPGVAVPVSAKVRLYGFVQLPLYQNLNGYQLAAKYTATLGARIEF